jgi:hypothetical protein
VPLDDALFAFKTPEGYAVETRQAPTNKPEADEARLRDVEAVEAASRRQAIEAAKEKSGSK